MKDLVRKADRGRLVRVAFGQFDVDLPRPASERGCRSESRVRSGCLLRLRTRGYGDLLSSGPLNETENSFILPSTSVTS